MIDWRSKEGGFFRFNTGARGEAGRRGLEFIRVHRLRSRAESLAIAKAAWKRMPLEAQTGFLLEPSPAGEESDVTTTGEPNKLPEPTTMSQRSRVISDQEIQDRRDLMKSLGQEEGDYPLSEGSSVVSVTPSTPSTPQPKTPKEWVAQMPEAAKACDELSKTLTDSEKLALFRQNGSLASSCRQPVQTQASRKGTRPSGMKLDITLCGLNDLPGKIGQRWTHVISIWDTVCRRNKAYRKLVRAIAPEARLLFCFFDDTSYPRDTNAPDYET